MPHEQMDQQQVAAYLRMDERQVVKLASRGQIPCRKVGGRFVFRKGEIDHWVEARMHTLGRQELSEIEKGVSSHHGFDEEALFVAPLIPAGGVAVGMQAKTREAAIRALVSLAEVAKLVHNRDKLLREVRNREELCSTALAPGVALPHPRHPLPSDIAASFVVVGLTPSGIPFGAADGTLTRLFFLICCKDDRTHLHVLARLGQMLHDPESVYMLLGVETPADLRQMILELEEQTVAGA